MGSIITFPGAVTTSPLGKFHQYEGTWDSTVYLWDAEYAPFSDIPANGTTFDNLLQARAAEVSGLTETQCRFDVTNLLNNGSAALASGEITSKKGLHVASPQSGSQVAPSCLGFSYSNAFANWLLSQTDAGADYAVMATIWLRCTRAGIGSPSVPQSLLHIVSNVSSTGNSFLYLQSNNGLTGGGGVRLINGQNPPTVGTTGVGMVSSQGWGGTKPANLDQPSQRRAMLLGASDAWGSFNYNLAGSFICYRTQLDIVDLSDISGATRSDKATNMIAALNTMAARDFGVGGRFYNDTFTPAATLKP